MSMFDHLSAIGSQLVSWLTPAQGPLTDFPFVASDVALYRRTAFDAGASVLDEQTWDDMLLESYSAQLAPQTSIFGQQELHRRLYAGGEGTQDSAARIRTLLEDEARLTRLQQACEGLRRAEEDASVTLFGAPLPATPAWVAHLRWLPWLFLGTAVLGLVTGVLACWLVVLGAWLALMTIQMRYHEAVEHWSRPLNTLRQMLRTHSLLGKLAMADEALAEPFRAGAAQAGKINRALSRSPFDQLPGVSDYSDWLWLKNVRHYFASRALVRQHLDFLRDSFVLVARLEADIALARHLARTSRHCWAEAGQAVALEEVVHPLLERAAPLDFVLDGGDGDSDGASDGGGEGKGEKRGAFISGQNGIGKSTLLRTVGLNLIVARAFGFCYAARAVTPLLPVYSSMQSEDALDSGESLYIAELRRAQELLALADQRPALFIIDEIFRGTNHLESISAAAAVLHTLAASGRVIVSSHNLVLAPLLADCLAPWCVSAPGGDQSRLQLAPGVLSETNGIALLGARGFGDEIAGKAKRVFDWLSDYMAHPSDCEGVVADAVPDQILAQ